MAMHLQRKIIFRIRIPAITSAAIVAMLLALGLLASPASASSLKYQLDPGDRLYAGQIIYPPSADRWVAMESNGDLTEYWGNSTPHLMAHTGTYVPGTVAIMQTDGNFVLVAPGNRPIWASGTNGNPGTVLQIQNDGGLALYAPGHRFLKFVFPPF